MERCQLAFLTHRGLTLSPAYKGSIVRNISQHVIRATTIG